MPQNHVDSLVDAKRLLMPAERWRQFARHCRETGRCRAWPEPGEWRRDPSTGSRTDLTTTVLPDGAGDTLALCTHTHLFKLFQNPLGYTSAHQQKNAAEHSLNCTFLRQGKAYGQHEHRSDVPARGRTFFDKSRGRMRQMAVYQWGVSWAGPIRRGERRDRNAMRG